MNVICRKDERKILDADIKKVNFIAYLTTPSSKIKFGVRLCLKRGMNIFTVKRVKM